jgi:hypothetical protein
MTNDVNFNIVSKIIIYTILTIKKIYMKLTNCANLILLNYIMIFWINFDVLIIVILNTLYYLANK